MAEHKDKKSYLAEGIPEYDFNKRRKAKDPRKGSGLEKHLQQNVAEKTERLKQTKK